MTTIRTAKPEEIPKLIQIYKECGLYKESISNEIVIRRGYERNPEMFIVAEEEGKVVGTVHGQSNGMIGFVWKLGVLPEYQRKGIGKALMKEILIRLRNDGCVGANLLVKRENTSIIELYESQHWEIWKHQLMVFPDLTRIEEYYE